MDPGGEHIKNDFQVTSQAVVDPGFAVADLTSTSTDVAYIADGSFISAFIATFSMIVVSELGDKTFFIAALLAMRYSRIIVYAGGMISLALMHVLSALLGFSATIIPRKFTQIAASLLFAVFGLHMLREAYHMEPGASDLNDPELKTEFEDVEAGLAGQQPSNTKWNILRRVSCLRRFVSPVFIEAFILTFLAEWGDRSQITTVVLAARGEDMMGIIFGGILGHGMCTAIAVLGGRAVAQWISPRTVTYIGGVTFLIFAVSTLVMSM